jgi:hypothetical protein
MRCCWSYACFRSACWSTKAGRLDVAERRLRAITRIDAKLDLLLKHADIQYNPYGGLPPKVMDALERGRRLKL